MATNDDHAGNLLQTPGRWDKGQLRALERAKGIKRKTMKSKRSITALALILVLVSACAMFQADPVGSSLVAAKNTYESYITQAGEAFKAGTITQPQLVEIRNVGSLCRANSNAAFAASICPDNARQAMKIRRVPRHVGLWRSVMSNQCNDLSYRPEKKSA